ncbi:ABC transporter substrate-binding protein [Undibacterium sp.]|uniref:substrate-binding periplasmic protein n=1 Tax=Undibacterium sp. TaxID=1914977 RepID=UPI002B663CE8|nr:ABC transporter substrate-binding protein [Undibacterium sp.]HTD05463.1 ABC transporter substrate-binding protein [Undibacterium sp.]
MIKSCALSLLMCTPLMAQANSLKLLIQEFAPFTHTDFQSTEIHGFVADKVAEIMKRAGESYTVTSTSLARAYQAALTEENTCMFAFRRTPDREKYFKWVGPLTTDNWVLYGRKSDPRALKGIEDAKPYTIGSYRNAATGLYLQEQGYKIQFANQDDDNPRLLVNGRLDYWIVSELHGMFLAQQQGYWNDISKVAKYRNIDLYMLCNAKMDKQRIDNFNQLNSDIDHDGTMDKLVRKYGIK